MANEVEWFLEKGRALPARSQRTLRTAFEVHQGQAGDVIRIPVVEGESRRADRNRVISKLEVSAQQVRRSVPVGTEVGITIDIDASRLLRTKANIPLLDEEFEEVLHLGGEDIAQDVVKLQQELEDQKKRLQRLKRLAAFPETTETDPLEQIEKEQIISDAENAFRAAETDPESLDVGDKRLRDLKIALDQAEAALEWPNLVQKAEDTIAWAREMVDKYGSLDDLRAFQHGENETQKAILTKNPDVLEVRVEALSRVIRIMLDRNDILPFMRFEYLSTLKEEMQNPAQAQKLIDEGHNAVKMQNVQRLRSINQQLTILLPMPPPPLDIGTLTR